MLLFLCIEYLWSSTFSMSWCICRVKRERSIILWWSFHLFLWTFSLFDKFKIISVEDIVFHVDFQHFFLLWCLVLIHRHRIVLKLGKLFRMLIDLFRLICESCPWVIMLGLDVRNIEIDIEWVILWSWMERKMSLYWPCWKINLCDWRDTKYFCWVWKYYSINFETCIRWREVDGCWSELYFRCN